MIALFGMAGAPIITGAQAYSRGWAVWAIGDLAAGQPDSFADVEAGTEETPGKSDPPTAGGSTWSAKSFRFLGDPLPGKRRVWCRHCGPRDPPNAGFLRDRVRVDGIENAFFMPCWPAIAGSAPGQGNLIVAGAARVVSPPTI